MSRRKQVHIDLKRLNLKVFKSYQNTGMKMSKNVRVLRIALENGFQAFGDLVQQNVEEEGIREKCFASRMALQ